MKNHLLFTTSCLFVLFGCSQSQLRHASENSDIRSPAQLRDESLEGCTRMRALTLATQFLMSRFSEGQPVELWISRPNHLMSSQNDNPFYPISYFAKRKLDPTQAKRLGLPENTATSGDIKVYVPEGKDCYVLPQSDITLERVTVSKSSNGQ